MPRNSKNWKKNYDYNPTDTSISNGTLYILLMTRNIMVSSKIVNIVGTSKIGEDFDLHSLAMSLEGAEYEPEQFPGLIYKITEPKASFLIFKSGKVVCTGTTSPSDAQAALEAASSNLKDIGLDVLPDPKIEIVNIVASGDMKSDNLNLNQVAMALGLENIEYEPEQFPGMVYRMNNPKVVTLIFSTGKVICTGAKNKEDVEIALTNLHKELTEHGFL
jgi:transcription initiation factor TFIID TATA-box-binding protein